jgi:hypothetical protein
MSSPFRKRLGSGKLGGNSVSHSWAVARGGKEIFPGKAMKKRRWLWLLLPVLLLAAGFVVLRLTLPSHNITAEAFNQIRHGMTEREVVAILGVKAGDYATGPIMEINDGTSSTLWIDEWSAHPGSRGMSKWISDEAVIHVNFDVEGKVGHAYFGHAYPVGRGPWDRFRRWLGRLGR